MKKIVLLILILLTIGCSKKQLEISKDFGDDIDNGITVLKEKNTEVLNTYLDDNPITVGLYRKGKLIKTYNKKFKDDTDIAIFNVIFSNKESLGSTNLKKNWSTYYNKYQNIDKYKIGFFLEFDADGKHMENLILDPSAKYNTGPYVFIYLYDGIHQKDGARYTHLEMKDLKENTIYSSIKLYMSTQTKKITSPISLTVFTYDGEDDFDEMKHYRGNSKYTITIYNK